MQTSLYGASKLAAEGLIAAYCEGYGIQAYDLPVRLDPGRALLARTRVRFLQAAGGTPGASAGARQRPAAEVVPLRAGLHRRDADGVEEGRRDRVNIFNLGTDEYCEVNDSIGWITRHWLAPARLYGRRARWIGDNPFIFLDCSRMRAMGWSPKHSIRESVVKTVEYLDRNQWLFESRS